MLSNLQVCFNAVMPLFLIMGLGYGVKCLGGIRVEDVHRELASRHIIDHKVKQEKMTK